MLRTFKDKHKGESCFIIGNGPSLKYTDLSLLKDQITFGLNRIYLLFGRLGFCTTYFVAINNYVIKQFASEIECLPCIKFISFDARQHIRLRPDLIFLRGRGGRKFCKNINIHGIWEGATVTYVAMQIAYFMGFSRVILIGVDHNFKTKGKPNEVIVSQGEDPDHFDENYFGQGVSWQLPDLETSEVAYKLAKVNYEKAGKQILDATVGGKLNIFPKVEFLDIIGELTK